MGSNRGETKTGRLTAVVFFGFLIILLNLFYMQGIRGGDYRILSEKNRLRLVFLEAPRGEITDRSGRALASNRLSFNCTAIQREAKNTIHESIQVIASLLGEDPEKLEKTYHRKKPGAYNTVVLAEDIDRDKAVAIEEALDSMPGILIETRPQREYAYGEIFAHLIGYLGPITEEETAVIRDGDDEYRVSDWLGREGIEKHYEYYLRGTAGGIQMEVNSRGRFLRALGVREPKEGRSLQLTVDADLQKTVQENISGKKAAVAIMDLSDGGLLSLNSEPTFDPNLFSSTRGRRDVGKFLRDEDSPMINRAISGQYPPGSIFKIVTTLAALENKKIRVDTAFDCQGYLMLGRQRFGCWRREGHGRQGLSEAIAHSCDVFFYLTGLATGVDALVSKTYEFGLGQKTGIDLPGEKSGTVPSREWKKKNKSEEWFDGDTNNLSIGQGFLQMTPIQSLVMIAAVAREGEVIRPHLIDKIDGIKVSEKRSTHFRISPEYLQALRRGLEDTVNSETGTGRLARIQGVRVVGKTGTAQSGQQEDHAWFVGYAPAKNPKVAMVVFVEHGGHGGVVAAGVAHKIFVYLNEVGYL